MQLQYKLPKCTKIAEMKRKWKQKIIFLCLLPWTYIFMNFLWTFISPLWIFSLLILMKNWRKIFSSFLWCLWWIQKNTTTQKWTLLAAMRKYVDILIPLVRKMHANDNDVNNFYLTEMKKASSLFYSHICSCI